MKKLTKAIPITLLILSVIYALNLRNDRKVLEYKLKNTDGLLKWYQKRTRIYVEVTRLQDGVIMNNRGSRLEKAGHKELLEQTQKLY